MIKHQSDLSGVTTYQAGVWQAAANRYLQKICDDILLPYGITKMQWLVIGVVADSGKTGIRVSELADQLGTTLPYLTASINMLEAKRILERKLDREDSRSKYVRLNNKFSPRVRKIEQELRKGLRESLYANVNPAELKIYLKVLKQLHNGR